MNVDVRLRLVGVAAMLLTSASVSTLVEGITWFVELTVVLAVAAAAGIGASRRVYRGFVPTIQLLVASLTLNWVYAAPESWGWVLPTGGSLTRLVDLGADGVATMARLAPPLPDQPGVRMLVVAGLTLVWCCLDLMACTLRVPAVAGTALVAVYAVPAALAREVLPIGWFALAGIGFLLLLGGAGAERAAGWGRLVSASRPQAAKPTTTTLGVRIAAASLGLAILASALVPGLTGTPATSSAQPGAGEGDGTIAVVNPILSLRQDLEAPGDEVVLEYDTTSSRPEPIRIVTVDSFDGNYWAPTYGALDRDDRVQDGLPSPPGLDPSASPRTATTTITITSLKQGLLPTPYPARRIDIDGNWLFDRATLNVFGDGSTTRPGQTYTVTHLLVDPTAAQLDSAPAPLPAPVARWVAVPPDLPAVIGQTAAEVAGSGSTYEQAMQLQTWLRSDGGFRYSLQVPADQGGNGIADFLQRKSGYCVHFASAMAVMARTLGIPARVAVGFQPGSRISGGHYVVRRLDAHAWPELYFDTVGWVRFEPTPAVQVSQLPTWAAPQSEQPGPAPTGTPSAGAPSTTSGQADDTTSSTASGPIAVLRRFPWRVGLGLLVVAALAAAPTLVLWAVRRSRLTRARDGRERAVVAWEDLLSRLDDLSVRPPASASTRGAQRLIAERVGSDAGATRALGRLADNVEVARYAPPPGRRPATSATLTQMIEGDDRADVRLVTAVIEAGLERRRVWRARLMPRSGVLLLRRLVGRVTTRG